MLADRAPRAPGEPRDHRRRDDAHRRRRALLGELLAHLEGRSGEVAAVHQGEGDAALEHGGGRRWRSSRSSPSTAKAPRRRCSTRRCSTRGRSGASAHARHRRRLRGRSRSIFTLFYRFGVRIPLRPFFAVTSVLLYYMAFVFMGKGIRELQEGERRSRSRSSPVPARRRDGDLSRASRRCSRSSLLLVLFVFAMVKTFWPKRSVTLPTVQASPPRSEPLEDRVAQLERKIAALERGLARGRKYGAWELEAGETVGAAGESADRQCWAPSSAGGIRDPVASRDATAECSVRRMSAQA